MPRQARLDAPGTLHHVIIRGIEKRRIVDDTADRKNFKKRLGTLASETHTAIYAWALMTNHAHILLRSSQYGLSKFMRRLLTGYAISYNRRHHRWGHLFQNRYKSIVCDENTYFMELVRYIHLNPLRANLVKNLAQLDNYEWSGHGALMGKFKSDWQDRDYVLRFFGQTEWRAKKAYRRHIEAGVGQGRRPELVGGGLIRSQGGWSAVLALRRSGGREFSDDRILGSGEFAERIIKEADTQIKYQLQIGKSPEELSAFISRVCKTSNISISEIKSGSRRRAATVARAEIVNGLVGTYGITMAEVARQVGVTTSAISKLLKRTRQ